MEDKSPLDRLISLIDEATQRKNLLNEPEAPDTHGFANKWHAYSAGHRTARFELGEKIQKILKEFIEEGFESDDRNE